MAKQSGCLTLAKLFCLIEPLCAEPQIFRNSFSGPKILLARYSVLFCVLPWVFGGCLKLASNWSCFICLSGIADDCGACSIGTPEKAVVADAKQPEAVEEPSMKFEDLADGCTDSGSDHGRPATASHCSASTTCLFLDKLLDTQLARWITSTRASS